jgi:hypothetical protein
MATPRSHEFENGSVASVCRVQLRSSKEVVPGSEIRVFGTFRPIHVRWGRLNGLDADIASGQFMAPLRKWPASTRLPKGAKLTPVKAVGWSPRKLEASRVSLWVKLGGTAWTSSSMLLKTAYEPC